MSAMTKRNPLAAWANPLGTKEDRGLSPALHGECRRSPSTPHSLLRPCTVSRGQRSTVVLSSLKKQKNRHTQGSQAGHRVKAEVAADFVRTL